MFVIKAIYPSGGHVVSWGGETLRFVNEQEARDRAEVMNGDEKKVAARNMRHTDVTYIVVPEPV